MSETLYVGREEAVPHRNCAGKYARHHYFLNMASSVWGRCKFLESADNLREVVKKQFGRELNTRNARGIASCLQQGRLFFEIAEASPLEVRPLIQYYGMSALAKALVAADRCEAITTLPKMHGIRDISDAGARILDLRGIVDAAGMLGWFNEVASKHNRLEYRNHRGDKNFVIMETARSASIDGMAFSLREILSRMGSLEDTYLRTFGVKAQVQRASFRSSGGDDCHVYIIVPEQVLSLESCKELVGNTRERYGFLAKWVLSRVGSAWGSVTLEFANIEFLGDEFQPAFWHADAQTLQPIVQFLGRQDWRTGISPPSGEDLYSCYLVEPLGDHVISSNTLQLAGTFLLSSLVRYRPDSWVHAITRSAFRDLPADDAALALVEEFLEHSSREFPEFIFRAMGA